MVVKRCFQFSQVVLLCGEYLMIVDREKGYISFILYIVIVMGIVTILGKTLLGASSMPFWL